MRHLPVVPSRSLPRALPILMALLAVLVAVAVPESLAAQAEQLGQQRLGRPYWHVFLAYAIGWVLILGWVVSIARRLRRVETRLADDGE